MVVINVVKFVKYEFYFDGLYIKNILYIRIVYNFLFEKYIFVVDCGVEKDMFKLDG